MADYSVHLFRGAWQVGNPQINYNLRVRTRNVAGEPKVPDAIGTTQIPAHQRKLVTYDRNNMLAMFDTQKDYQILV